jgi:hypothetical protein
MKRSALRKAILILLGALLWPRHAAAQTVRYVDNLTTCATLAPCYPTIMEAVDASAPADVIEVFAGVYVEAIVLSDKSGLVLKAYDEDLKPVIVAPDGAGSAIYVVSSEGVQVQDFVLEAPQASAIRTVGLGAGGIVIQGNVIKSGGISMAHMVDSIIKDNTIIGSGISLPLVANRCLIEGNRLIDAGIEIAGSDNVVDNVIRNNILLRGGIGLSGRPTRGNIIESNRLYGGGIGISGSQASGNVIRLNVVRGGGSIGFRGDMTGGTIESNVVSGSHGDGIYVGALYGSPGGAIHVQGNTSIENAGCDLHDLGGNLIPNTWSENRFGTSCGDLTPNSPPNAVAAASTPTVECSGPSGGSATLDASGSQDPDSSPGTNDDIASFEWFEHYGEPGQILLGSGARLTATLPLGSHTVSLKVTDLLGLTAMTTTVVTVVDTTTPSLVLTLSPTVLWPPNRKMVPVEANWLVRDACDPSPRVSLTSATSSEPGDDAIRQEAPRGTAPAPVLLRADRSGNGPGRTYTLTWTATDASGNNASATGLVTVPHHR